MRISRLAGPISLLIALMLVAAQALPASAAPVRFGAKLNRFTQPANAESGKRCSSEISGATACTWVETVAHNNAGGERAPKTGTITRVRLVSCIAGSFKLQIARVRKSTSQARVVRTSSLISYSADPRHVDGDSETYCGGEGGDDYIVQSKAVNIRVDQGDWIAVRAARVGMLYCSGDGAWLFDPPLVAGGGFQTRDDVAGNCELLVQLQYAS